MSYSSPQAPEWAGMSKIVAQIYARSEAEPFREPVDWKSMGLLDYPQIIKKPMDLGQVKRKIEMGSYSTIHDAADDVRLIWKNCMQYNADGSDFFILAQNMSKRFEDRFAKLLKDVNVSSSTNPAHQAGGAGAADADLRSKNATEPTLDEKRSFAKSLYKITKEELGKIIVDLDAKSPASLTKNAAEDEVEINVDLISPLVFHEVMTYIKTCGGGDAGGGRKKKTNKKSRMS